MRHIKNLLAPKLLLVIAFFYTLLITIGSLISTSSIPKFRVAVSDKLIHSACYFVLVLLWFLFFLYRHRNDNFKFILIATACLSFVYGIIIEVAQEVFSKTRTFDIFDVFANGVGIAAAVFLLILFQSKLLKLKSKN